MNQFNPFQIMRTHQFNMGHLPRLNAAYDGYKPVKMQSRVNMMRGANVMEMEKHKKLTRKSGITIPKDLRHETGFTPSMAIDLVSVPEGILVRKHVPTCNLCGSPFKVVTVNNFDVCRDCAYIIYGAVRDKYGE